MGSGMARNLIAAGLDVTVWNRSPDRARALADAGARMTTDAAEAVAGAEVVVTMLFDLAAVEQVMEWALPAMEPGAVWVQTSTVGLEGTDRLAALAGQHGVGIVTAGTAQAIATAEGLGLNPQLFLDTIGGGTLDAPYVQLKGRAMIADEFPTSFSVSGVVKDLGLIGAAMRGADVRSEVLEAVRAAFRAADAAGHGDEDMAAVVHAFRP